jgi:hypothetical protein
MTTNPRRKTIIQGVSSLLIILFGVIAVHGQKEIVFTQKFTDLLDEYDLIYERPVEKWYRIQPFENRFSEYDLVLRTFEEDLEIRHIIRQHPPEEPPQVHAPLLLNHMATNQEAEDILIAKLGSKELDGFQADWGMYADFTPKKAVTEFRFARLISIYRQGGPMVHTLLFQNESFGSMDQDEACIIRFANDRKKEN